MKGVQCYELFGGIALKNHAFSFFIFGERKTIQSIHKHYELTAVGLRLQKDIIGNAFDHLKR